eukprot:CAMPEP_0197826748 /NCGR_PEP_ID=MMETSP1437-20131217/3657_1 /TAXON_ID=49252 ORGANISM="Eucampia antarctica, Strain CCMP1452" /NCGR_SAMPLE_ID=MMETSP1437 /ASSEMBLY_ACC=CAM_ASM_001096 /LENGTH=376 /DNA_ID=CAMNT_0043427317 /DNA_START=91 /DNA_END=1221 /DNA_ORIENTATION=-
MGTKVDAADIAKPFRDEVRDCVKELKEQGIATPLLVGLLANQDPAAKKYAEWTGRACRLDGLRYELREVADSIDVEEALWRANEDPNVHGILVYYPIFGSEPSFSGASQDDYLRDSVSYKCDVEGLCHTYRSHLYRNVRHIDFPKNSKKCLLPCTALSVVKVLEHVGANYSHIDCYDHSQPPHQHMTGQVVTVINRSEIVGRPLAAMLANDGAHVYSVDVESIYLFRDGKLHKCPGETPESCVRKSSVVITGVPTKDYRLPSEWVNPNSTVINVSSFKNVDEESLLKIEGVVYVPMVGKVTVAMLERNLMRLYNNYHHPHRLLLDDEQKTGSHHSNPQQQNQNQPPPPQQPWYGSPMQLYIAAATTVLLATMWTKK